MSTPFTCDDTETLVAYIYDEAGPAMRDAVARHLVECARCRNEVAALGGVRHALAQWTPPAPPLRFTVVQEPVPPMQESASGNVIRPAVASWQTVPVWAQVAAATLAVAVGAAIANVQVRHDTGGWTVSTGWMPPRPGGRGAATRCSCTPTPTRSPARPTTGRARWSARPQSGPNPAPDSLVPRPNAARRRWYRRAPSP